MTDDSSWKATPQAWGRVKDAIRESRSRPTQAEAAFWDILRGRRSLGLKFRRQHAIGPYIVDFYCAQARLVIEVDGPIHDQQTENDAARSAFLEANGLRVLRFRNESVLKHPDKVLDDIQSFLAKEP